MRMKNLICHRIPERSFFYKGRQFPVCARCTGVYMSILTVPIIRYLDFGANTLVLGGIILAIPMAVDGLTQLFGLRKSNNHLRLVTGFIGGIGVLALAFGFKMILMEFL